MTSSSSRRPSGSSSSAQSRAKRAGRPASSGRAGQSKAAPHHAIHLAPESLGFALDTAAHIVGSVRAGAALPAALTSTFAALPHEFAATARGAVQDIAYRTMRRLGTVDWLIKQRVSKAPPPLVTNLLACALALLVDDEAHAAYTPFTVVDQAVRAIGARRDIAFAKGLVNAVLRGFLRERESALAAAQADEVARWNYPQWWIDAIRKAWPERWQAILEAGNTQGPLTLRVNARRASTTDYLQRLADENIAATQIGDHAVRLAAPLPVDRIPGFMAGDASVQDAGAQIAAQILGVRDGMRVLDACAAPGGKSGHLLELADIDLVALESDAARAARIGENFTRLGFAAAEANDDADDEVDHDAPQPAWRARVVIGDAGAPERWFDGAPFDRILADVPCSASGIVRRHPDIRWLRRQSDIGALVQEQRRIVEALWALLKPGGELLYVTCSIFPEEGEAQASWFESTHADAVRLDAPGQLLPATGGAPAGGAQSGAASVARRDAQMQNDARPVPDRTADHDGFFYARFQKR
ncbi:Ribosomal RNA small subunit methyltransferase B [Paraburkholderia caffeinitolerans]|uniref:Ribosomal RNA small subunit methyltransferase B n=1 Tax=Paraburkholderia caffeinitolerans TaxID=1723730 RepID=A0A6J5FJL1_9BURK|nr:MULTISPECIES: 16S rRNA (cytosine(967)-C(5))-methyltransferase RsmB [Paraburkholderia]CAB3781153.1 Ribosomal RNA small subunit methyltransferase B [Paraburkholderia caffeinitolerans]